jgi:hypothetical protein
MIIIIDVRIIIFRVRKKLNERNKWIKTKFGNQIFKFFNISEFIDMYNYFMNGIDQINQIRIYYRTNRRNYRI